MHSSEHVYVTNNVLTHNCSFGILYGISATGLQAQLKSKCHTDWTVEQCEDMIDKWLDKAYPRVKWYMERQKSICRRKGYVESMFGRRRYLPGVNSTIPRLREEAHRAAINHPIQSTATEILKVAIKNIWDRVLPDMWSRGIDAQPILLVHDEIIMEVQTEYAVELNDAIVWEMEHAVELCVPVVAEGHISDESWAGIK